MCVEEMTYWGFLEWLVERAGRLSERALAGLYWLFGCGLLVRCPLPPGVEPLVADAVDRGFRFATTGVRHGDDAAAADALDSFPLPDEVGQYVISTVSCLSYAAFLPASPSPNMLAQVALFPVMRAGSLQLWEDIVEPGSDEDYDQVFRLPVMQEAAAFCVEALAVLQAHPVPSPELLEGLRPSASVLSPPEGTDWDLV